MSEPAYYCGGGMTDIGSYHQEHWSPQTGGKPPKWCHGDPRRNNHALDSTKTGDAVTTHGWCIYCQRNTTWSIRVIRPGVLHFRCEDCKKIERDVTLPDPGGQ